MMVVEVFADGELSPGRPVPLIEPWPYYSTIPVRAHDVLADGSFVATLERVDAQVPEGARVQPSRLQNRVSEIHVVLNWVEELRERLGAR